MCVEAWCGRVVVVVVVVLLLLLLLLYYSTTLLLIATNILNTILLLLTITITILNFWIRIVIKILTWQCHVFMHERNEVWTEFELIIII